MKKRKMFIYLFLLFCIVLTPCKAGAEEGEEFLYQSCDTWDYACVTCEYAYESSNGYTLNYKFYVKEQKNGTIKVVGGKNQTTKITTDAGIVKQELEYENDIENYTSYLAKDKRVLTCPETLHYADKKNGTGNNQKRYIQLTFNEESVKNPYHIKIALTNKWENKKEYKSEDISPSSKTCTFTTTLLNNNLDDIGNITISFNTGKGFKSPVETTNKEKYTIEFNGYLNEYVFEQNCNRDDVYILCQKGKGSTPNRCVFSLADDVPRNQERFFYNSATGENLPSRNDNTDESDSNDDNGDVSLETCEEIMGDMTELINDVYKMIEILAPILLIVFGCIDFGSAVVQNDNDALKKATNNFIKRTIATAAIFLLPFIVSLIMSLPGIETGLEDVMCGLGKVIIK